MGYSKVRTCARVIVLLAPLGAAVDTVAAPPLAPESIGVERLGPPQPHWIVVNDPNFLGSLDSKVYLFDADTGRMLGMLSTGGYNMAVELAPDGSMIYSPETYYPRGTRGERTDVVTFYDVERLAAVGEVVIPPKRATGLPIRAYTAMSDDGALVYVTNMTPATSVSVVDTKRRQFVAEVDTAGCALAYPTGPRSFASLCGDGSVLAVQLGPDGREQVRARSPRFFDADADPVTEKAARHGDTWLFVSFEGWVHPVRFGEGAPVPLERWSLFTDEQRGEGWRIGGMQFTALDDRRGKLYAIVHQGGAFSHKDPGEDVWVWDLASRARERTIELVSHAMSLALSRDEATLLYTTTLDVPGVQVYDALTGEHRRAIDGPPLSPSFVEVP